MTDPHTWMNGIVAGHSGEYTALFEKVYAMAAQHEPFTDGEFGPWPMTRAEVEAFGETGLRAAHLQDSGSADDATPPIRRWVAEFRR